MIAMFEWKKSENQWGNSTYIMITVAISHVSDYHERAVLFAFFKATFDRKSPYSSNLIQLYIVAGVFLL